MLSQRKQPFKKYFCFNLVVMKCFIGNRIVHLLLLETKLEKFKLALTPSTFNVEWQWRRHDNYQGGSSTG